MGGEVRVFGSRHFAVRLILGKAGVSRKLLTKNFLESVWPARGVRQGIFFLLDPKSKGRLF